MLKIQDSKGKDLFVVKDDATEPEQVGELEEILDEVENEDDEESEEE